MDASCRENEREPNRRHFMNKCDQRLSAVAGHKPPDEVSEPHGWKAFLNHEYPESRFSREPRPAMPTNGPTLTLTRSAASSA